MRNTIFTRLGFAMIVIGGLLGLLQSQTTIFDAVDEPAVIGFGGGLLMIAGVVVLGVVMLKRRVTLD